MKVSGHTSSRQWPWFVPYIYGQSPEVLSSPNFWLSFDERKEWERGKASQPNKQHKIFNICIYILHEIVFICSKVSLNLNISTCTQDGLNVNYTLNQRFTFALALRFLETVFKMVPEIDDDGRVSLVDKLSITFSPPFPLSLALGVGQTSEV